MMISRAYEKIKAKKAEKKVREEELERGASNGRQPAQAPSTDSPSASELVGKPVLDDGDESFLRQLTNGDCRRDSTEEGPAPPLPPRVKTPVIEWDSDDDEGGNREGGPSRKSNREARPSPVKKEGVEAISPDRKKKKQKKPKASRFSIFVRKQDTKKGLEPEHLAPVSKPEAERERDDLTQVLDDLNLSACNNRAF
ncbi:MAG: hypothetical protein OK454_01955, partial [Thaumarchaeota archaeon]|nr:hypothetical protein [Nitrososphaerota archaeon]